jgi:carbonic anhydrase
VERPRAALTPSERCDILRSMQHTLSSLVLVALVGGCVAPHGHEGGHGPGEDRHEPHWSYEGSEGPAHWGDLSAAYRACSTGRAQSPIDIELAHADHAALPPLQVHYQATAATEIDNGHTIQDNVAPGDTLELDGTRYELQQFHVHHPSEHLLDGRRFPLEVHLVHRAASGALLVLGVLVDEGLANHALGELVSHLPHRNAIEHLTIDPSELLPADHHYATYTGSLTTPPCTEGVTWIVLTTPIHASRAQLDRVARAVRDNARPVMPLAGRHVVTDAP